MAKYVVYVDVGSLSKDAAKQRVSEIAASVQNQNFFDKEKDKVLYIASNRTEVTILPDFI